MLNKFERGEVADLLEKAMDNRLSVEEERRLRFLMSAENPSAPVIPLDRLIDAGCFMVGVWMHFEQPMVRTEA